MTNACINKENLGSEQANNLDVFEGVEFSTKVVLDGGKMSSDDFAKATSAEEYTIIGNMWYSRQFEAYLQALGHASGGGKGAPLGSQAASAYSNPYRDRIEPQLKKGVISSILAARDSITQNERFLSHEMFGYDFMVDTNMNVWLIEVNSSPSMDYSSPVTENLVK